MWEPVQIRHRSAYYDAFFTEALLSFIESGLAAPAERPPRGAAIAEHGRVLPRAPAARTCDAHDGRIFRRHHRAGAAAASALFAVLRADQEDLGFGLYVPDCDTTACSFSAATQAGSTDPILDQPLLDFYAGYQVGSGSQRTAGRRCRSTTTSTTRARIATWIDNLAGERPYGNDLDPTLNLDVLEVSFRNLDRWQVLETPQRLETVQRIIGFQRRLAESGAFADPRSHIYYLPELYCAYFGRCYAAFKALPPARSATIDPDGAFDAIRDPGAGLCPRTI